MKQANVFEMEPASYYWCRISQGHYLYIPKMGKCFMWRVSHWMEMSVSFWVHTRHKYWLYFYIKNNCYLQKSQGLQKVWGKWKWNISFTTKKPLHIRNIKTLMKNIIWKPTHEFQIVWNFLKPFWIVICRPQNSNEKTGLDFCSCIIRLLTKLKHKDGI